MRPVTIALAALFIFAASASAQQPACTYQNCPADLQFRTPLRTGAAYVMAPIRSAVAHVARAAACRMECAGHRVRHFRECRPRLFGR